MTNMDKKSKFFKTLKKDWTDLQSTVQKDIFGKQLKNLSVFSSIIQSLHPVIDSVAKALGGLLVQLGKATQTNAFKTMMKNFGDALGPMVTTIGHIAGNLGTFLIRAFVIATPYIQRFLDWLDRVTKKWVEFTKGGKNGSKSGFAKFLDKAVTSAEHLWGLLKEVGLTLLDLLGGGKATGDNVLVKMQGWVHNIRVWLEDPKNKKTIEQWWKDAETLGDKLGRVVTLVAQFVGNLDNPQSRKNLDDILTSLGDIIIKVDQAIPVVQSYITNIGAFFQPVNDAIKSLNVEFDKIDARAKEKTAKNQAQPQGFDRIFKGGPIQAVTDFVNFMNSKWPGVHESFMRNIGDPVANFFTTTLPARAAPGQPSAPDSRRTWSPRSAPFSPPPCQLGSAASVGREAHGRPSVPASRPTWQARSATSSPPRCPPGCLDSAAQAAPGASCPLVPAEPSAGSVPPSPASPARSGPRWATSASSSWAGCRASRVRPAGQPLGSSRPSPGWA
jgi:hypothetical protein